MSNIIWYEDIKASILIDVLNWKTFETSYEHICKRFGENSIQKTDYLVLFNEFVKETRDLSKTQTNISEIIFNESVYPRYRIFRDVISKVPISTSYKGLYETIENINYPEFEFWYYRFYNGQRELDYDRSKDPKSITFSDLPIDVIEKIVEKSGIKSRYKLRKVSHDLRSLVDSSVLKIEKISFNVEMYTITINVDDDRRTISIDSLSFLFEHFFNDACIRLATFIRTPKLQLGSLDIQLFHNYEENDQLEVSELFKSISYQLHVRNLKIRVNTKEELLDIIMCMKPKILKKIEIGCHYTGSPINISEIVESEQWKQAEEITIINPITCNIAHFLHFKSFDICLRRVSVENILELRNKISKSLNFEWCRLRADRRILFQPEAEHGWPSNEEIQTVLETRKDVHDNMEYFVYNIPNSTETLVFSFFNREIFIKKTISSF